MEKIYYYLRQKYEPFLKKKKTKILVKINEQRFHPAVSHLRVFPLVSLTVVAAPGIRWCRRFGHDK